MRRSKRGTKEVAIRYNKLGIYLWEMKEVGGKRETTRFPEGRFSGGGCEETGGENEEA